MYRYPSLYVLTVLSPCPPFGPAAAHFLSRDAFGFISSSSSPTLVSPAPLALPPAPPALSILSNDHLLSIAPTVPCTHTHHTSPSYLRGHALLPPAAPTGSFSRFFPRSYLGLSPFSPTFPRWPPAISLLHSALSPPCTTAHRAIYVSPVACPSSPPLADIPAASHAHLFRTPRVPPSSFCCAVSRRLQYLSC
ncbi:hypothetical protein PYCCODRAFT_1435123 [Trametes coccinea BRFM310]|uniref:Uncharacterized protein n=1 Tax=Trametes coccinea (strain BRFM310) TaxID=1353009 RepID=A0A1Y2INZ7_TRAC3|nr:hypothetical protein PYCCODRAFT_1435123 [Trametes coccinea BRFM310]